MEEINRLHDIADDIGSTSWGYELASALHNIAADIGEKVDEMLRVLGADGVEVHKGDEVWSTTGEFDGKRTVSSVHIDPDEPPYAMFEERQKPYSCLCCYLTHRAPVIAADGEPLEVGQKVWVAENGNRFRVVRLCDDGLVQGTLNGDLMKYLRPEKLTHQRPVLDADGNRIEPAMDVWWVCEGDERGVHAEKLHVESIGEDGLVTCGPFNSGTWVELEPSELYVNRPVLDAGGVPIKKGDTVWYRGHTDPLEVRSVAANVNGFDYVTAYNDYEWKVSAPAKFFTHTKPEPSDTWEQIEQDAGCTVTKYNERRGTIFITKKQVARDLVRRCKEVARKENNNE